MQLIQDIRLGVRQLLRQRAFTVVALTTIALSIAATAVVFSVTFGVLMRPLPFAAPDELLQVHEVEKDGASGTLNTEMHFAWQNYADIRDQVKSFGSLTAFQYYDRTLTGAGTATRMHGRMITPEFFDVFRVKPVLGRPFTKHDVVPGSERAALISYDVWRNRFGSDVGIVDRTVQLDGLPFTVVGVMPAGFDYPDDAELWMPLVPSERELGVRRYHRYRVVGRLAADATAEQAQIELSILARRLEQSFPETNTDNGFRAVALIESVAGAARPALRVLMSAVVLLLLIGCANVAGLQLVRAAAREREIGIRAALGAARGRIVTQLLVENLVLATAGGAIGLLLATWGLEGFKRLLGDALPRADQVRLDGYGILFTMLITMAAGIVFGIAPAFRSSRPALSRLLRGGRAVASERSLTRLRGGLVIGQLALAIVLTIGAVLLVRSFQRLREVDDVAEPGSLLMLDVSLPEARYGDAVKARTFYNDLLPRIEALPQVQAAAATMVAPLAGVGWGNRLHIEGRPLPEQEQTGVGYVITSAGYFRTTGIPLLEGRDFDATEAATRPAVIINRALARRYWPNQTPIGQRVRFSDNAEWATVIGVARDVPHRLGLTVEPEAYVPFSIEALRSMTLLVRMTGQTSAVAGAVRALLTSIDRDLPITRVITLEDELADSIARPRYTAAIVALFAIAALFLASVGIYGVLAYAVSQRARELGIRMAIGATRADILALVLRDGLRLATFGMIVGLSVSLVANQFLQGLLYGISATDPATIGVVMAFTFGITLLASWLPARRAGGIAPAHVLGRE
jgi:putative ABC transport system permease protein